jgi:4-carboxymuconolactone decarboxylase
VEPAVPDRAERLPRLVESELDEAQREVYRAIAGGPRASGPQLFALQDDRGALNGPFGLMLHVPELGLPLQELGSAIRYRTGLTDRCREIAILKVALSCASDFEWYAHERVALAVGMTAAELADLRNAVFRPSDPAEAAVVELCDLLLEGEDVDDERYRRLAGALGAERLFEVVVLVGYYRTLAALMDLFAVGAPEG